MKYLLWSWFYLAVLYWMIVGCFAAYGVSIPNTATFLGFLAIWALLTLAILFWPQRKPVAFPDLDFPDVEPAAKTLARNLYIATERPEDFPDATTPQRRSVGP